MAFKKKAYVRKRKPATSWYNRKYSVGQLATKALAGVSYIKSMINAEAHYHPVTSGPNSIDYNGTLLALSSIDVGDTNATRTGNSILLKNQLINYNISMDTTVANCTVRLIVFMDTMNLGTAPAVGDVLETVGSVQATLTPLDRVYAISGRFKILSDRRFLLSNNGKNASYFKWYKTFDKTHIKYTGTSGTDEGKNQIYLIMISNLVTSNLPLVTVNSRLVFYDN